MDRQTLMVRRAMAAGAGLVVLLVLILGLRACLDSRKERAFTDYTQDVNSLVQQSDQESSKLFELLQGRGGRGQAVNIENTLNALRGESAQLVDQANNDLDPPDELKSAQRYLVETLEFRRDGLEEIANALPTALGDQDRRQGTRTVAFQMQVFLASDVIYSRRFVPKLAAQLKEQELDDQLRIPRSQFLPNVQWIDPAFVTERVDALRSGGGGAAAPGLHGTGLGTVTVGGQTLTPGGTATVAASADLAFAVQVVNQGENDESDVTAKVTIGSGANRQALEGRVDSIARGETKSVNIPVKKTPPTGQAVQVTVEVEPVPGEKKTDNNKASFSVIFTR